MLVLSDVCDTLIDLNSTDEYIKFLCNHGYWSKVYWFLLNNYLFRVFSYVIYRVTWVNIHRRMIFKFFKNLKKSYLNCINTSFFEFYLSKKTKILDRIIQHKEKWDKVILVSASINPPIEMLWKFLWVDYFSSELEEKEGVYTWKCVQDLLWCKENLLLFKNLDISQYKRICFYTDNLSDIGFIIKIWKISKHSKFYLIVKSENMKKKRQKLLSSNNIVNYEFIS